MKFAFPTKPLMIGVLVSLFAVPAFAVPVSVSHQNLKPCDVLFVPERVDELGIGSSVAVAGFTGPFPKDEEISAYSFGGHWTSCQATDNPDIADAIVDITNLTQPARSFRELWYVGNPNTFLSNVDGTVSQLGFEDYGYGLAFRIDDLGANKPLMSESINANGIFEPNETWTFSIQDFAPGTAAGMAAQLTSIGVAGGSLLGGDSSGSIIGIPIPEPSSLGLLMLGTMGVMVFCRRK
jgi:hypothetical protein